MLKNIYTKYSIDRSDEFKIRTSIILDENGKKFVRKYPYSDEAIEHIKNIYNLSLMMSEQYDSEEVSINKCEYKDGYVEFPFITGVTYEELLDKKLETQGVKAVLDEIYNFAYFLRNKAHDGFERTEDFMKVFGNISFDKNCRSLNIANIDFIFPNIIVTDKWNIIDYEWSFCFDIPVDFVLYRAVSAYVYGLYDSSTRDELKNINIEEKLGINPAEIEIYEKMNNSFSEYVTGNSLTGRELQGLIGKPVIDVKKTNKLFMDNLRRKTIQIFYDYGEGFSSNDSEYIMPSWNSDNEIDISVEVPENCKTVRIDPMIGYGFFIIRDIITEKSEKISYEVNGISFDSDKVVFYNDDPQIVIKDVDDIKTINLSGRVVFSEKNVNEGIIELIKLKDKHIEEVCIEKNDLNKQIVLRDDEISKKNNHINNLQTEIYMLNNSKAELENKCIALESELNQNIIIRLLKSNKVTLYIGKFIKSIFRDGPKQSFFKVKRKLSKKFYKEPLVLKENIYDLKDYEERILDIDETDSINKSIAIHLHLFYEDLLPEFVWYLDNMPFDFDLYISCQKGANISKINKKVKRIKHVKNIEIKEFENRGRDIAPLYVHFRDKLEKYDYLLHMHTKKSLYTGTEKIGWRQMSLDTLLGSETIIKKIFNCFERKEVGLIYPEFYSDFCKFHCSWLTNDVIGRQFLDKLGIHQEEKMFTYPAGSFFWAKVDAIRPLFDLKLKIEDFPEEKGQTDTTLAHVLERAISCVSNSQGYMDLLIDLDEGVIRKRRSLKMFRDYIDSSVDDAINEIKMYDIVSFSIFDTLINEKLYKKKDLFKYMMSVDSELTFSDFCEKRAEAERKAIGLYGDKTNLDNIYDCLGKDNSLSEDEADSLKQLEEKCLLELAIPRADVKRIYDSMVYRDKKIVFIDDTYYSKDIIEKLLYKCGFNQYDSIWISNEYGLRKDKDELWTEFFDFYCTDSIIHIGSNPRADWQTVYDRGKHAYWLMGSYDEYYMSSDYDELNNKYDEDIKTSLELGELIQGVKFNSPFAII